MPFFLADFEDGNGKPLDVCPRKLLRGAIQRAKDMGFRPCSAFEFEWFNFKETAESLRDKRFTQPEPITPGMFGYSILRLAQNQPFFNALMDELLAFRVPIEGFHTETGPGVVEAAILYSGARSKPPTAPCSSRPVPRRSGSASGSCRASWPSGTRSSRAAAVTPSRRSGMRRARTPSHDPASPHRMSSIFKSYLAGQMKLSPGDLAVFRADREQLQTPGGRARGRPRR